MEPGEPPLNSASQPQEGGQEGRNQPSYGLPCWVGSEDLAGDPGFVIDPSGAGPGAYSEGTGIFCLLPHLADSALAGEGTRLCL